MRVSSADFAIVPMRFQPLSASVMLSGTQNWNGHSLNPPKPLGATPMIVSWVPLMRTCRPTMAESPPNWARHVS
jgi:hypothetical protein